ncbi:MAG TPA: malectin domain-containing carbohydrate-binding protein [Terriglobales bacterium]|jgi:outer membrane protein assembly factor BamB|nr:malectin domain-containing carbohydrate-binding protein [Terriglobales bacterium]
MNAFQLKRAFRPVLMSLFLALTFFVMLSLRGYLNPPKVVRAQSGPTITDWQQFGGDPTHSGANNSETIINASNVSGLKNVFTFNLAAGTDASVVALTGVSTSSGVRDLVFVNSKLGDFYALDAKTGAVVWTAKAAGGFNNSSPAIDPNRQFVYFPGADGFAHKFNVADGVEVKGGGFPAMVTSCSGTKIPSALGIATDASGVTRLYGSSSGFGACPHGSITAIDLATGTQHVFNAACSNVDGHVGTPGITGCANGGSGVWSRAGEVYDPATNLIYVATAEFGAFSPSTHRWSQTLLAINPDGTTNNGNPVDSNTPTNFASEIAGDIDYGSNNPTIMPDLPGSTVAHVVLMCGKDAQMRLLNANNLNGHNGPGFTGGDLSDTPLPQGGEAFSQIALYTAPDGTHWVIAPSTHGIAGLVYTLNAANQPTLIPKWHLTNGWVTSPVVANGVVFGANEAGQVFALNLTTGAQLWSATTNGRHWSSPVVVNGMLYITDGFGATGGRLLAFGLPSSGGNPPPAPALATPSAGNNQVSLSWSASTGASSYNVKRTLTSGMNYALVASGVTATSFTDTTVTNGTKYFYVVSAQNAAGESANSNEVSATPTGGVTPPTAPTLATPTAGNNQVSLSWSASAGASTYNVKRTLTSGANYAVVASGLTATSFTDTTVTNGTKYFYVVSAQNAAGESPNSNEVSATPASGPVIAINAGGPAVSPFAADMDFVGGTTINHANTINLTGVTNPAPMQVYQTARIGNFTYTIPGGTAGSSHTVRLHFAETFWTAAGKRRFNVSINGTQVLTNFDIFAAAGAMNKATIQQFTVNANAAGQYVIQFTAVTDKSLLSGIEVQ